MAELTSIADIVKGMTEDPEKRLDVVLQANPPITRAVPKYPKK